ncbi:hypothetical protein J1614_011232 [Plenodomus biglobosus]|nr:hypothetical protein J1614_011232 [Plenodomus biglobosus]
MASLWPGGDAQRAMCKSQVSFGKGSAGVVAASADDVSINGGKGRLQTAERASLLEEHAATRLQGDDNTDNGTNGLAAQ